MRSLSAESGKTWFFSRDRVAGDSGIRSRQDRFRWLSASVSHRGNVREINEDACLAMPERGLWVVADGMGGHASGDVASRMIVDTLSDVGHHENPANLLDEVEDRLLIVNSDLFLAGRDSAAGIIGSTVIALLANDRNCIVIWAGDSRAYRLRGDLLKQLTVDHSQVEEMVKTGMLLPEEAENHPLSNVITRAVGGREDLHLDVELMGLRDGDRYLLCTDGLYKELSDVQIARYLSAPTCKEACDQLLAAALTGEASDNITVAVIEFRQTED